MILARHALILLFLAKAAGAACPNTTCTLDGVDSSSPEPTGSAHQESGYPGGSVTVTWDAPLGNMTVSVYGCCHDAGGYGTVTISDEFEVVGPPPGTEIHVTARLSTGGNSFSYFGDGADFWGSLSDSQGHSGTYVTDSNKVYELPLVFVVGTKTTLYFLLGGDGSGASENASAHYAFPDLPANCLIRSCRGYQSGGAVAARSSSWGGLKRLYR